MRCEVQSFRSCVCAGIIAVAVCLLPNISALVSDSGSRRNSQDAEALVRDVMHHEIESQLRDASFWCYREQLQEDSKPSKTLEVCQTKDGDLERLLAVDGRELNPAQRQAEDERVQDLISHPEQLKSKQRKEREDGEQARSLLKIFAEAFQFQCESESGSLVTVRFHPNPGFRPSTRASQVFHHMEGTLVVDAEQKRLVEINGRLVSEVRFGGGLLGHLDKNGTFQVKQQDVGEGHWDLSLMSVHMSGKALFFKSITVLEKKSLFDYKPLPRDATLQQTADFLRRDFDVHSAASLGK